MTRGLGAILLLAGYGIAYAQPYVISTVAGGAPPPAGIAATSASIVMPVGVTADTSGVVYFSSNNAVFKIDPSGTLVRVAGTSRAGFSGDGGPATSAQLDDPNGVAVDSAGNLYIADSGNNRVRKVTSAGIISTVAGTGVGGFSSDAVPAATSQLYNPVDVAVDTAGNLYIADAYNRRIRKITNGTISTIAGDGTCCFSGDNGPATSAQLYQPQGVAVDSSGNVYLADLGSNRIRKVSPTGTITTVAGFGSLGFGGDGGPATAAQMEIVWAVAVDSSGNFYISDGNRIRKVSGGTITTIAGQQTAGYSGDGQAATKAQLDGPFSIFVDKSGNLLLADTGNARVRKMGADGNITTIAGDGTHNYSGDGGPATSAQIYSPQGLALGAPGTVYVSDYARLRAFTVGAAISTAAPQFNQPEGIAYDPASGTLYAAEPQSNRVRKVTSNGTVSLVAGTGTAGYSGDGGAAPSAQLRSPDGLALDTGGNLYIVDSGNAVVRRVTPSGTISTVAGNGSQGYGGDGGPATSAQLSFPRGIAVDASGNLYVADFGNGRIRKVSAGTITTVAGAGSTSISPQGVAVDSTGNLYIGDYNNTVWKVRPDGTLIRIAGTGAAGYTGDGGSAATAQVSDVRGVAVDATGNVYFSDTSNNAIRVLRPVTALLTITTPATLPGASLNAPYSQQLATAGGSGSLSWSLVSGALPAGLTLSAAGVISGTPTASGTSTFTIAVTDSTATIANSTFSLTVSGPTITTSSPLLQGTVGINYSQTLLASGGATPYVWTLSSGTLPPQLALSAAGVISGIPTTAGTFNFVAKLTDAAGSTSTQNFTIVVLAAPPLSRSGVLAHIAAGGSWTTAIYLANASANQVGVAITFHADDGSALNLPLTVTQGGAAQTATTSQITIVLMPNSTLVVDAGQQIAALVTGWADIATSGPVSGFAIFRTTDGITSEGTSPLQTQFQSRIDLPYDNRNGFVTAVALANLASTPVTVTATMWDSTGTLLGTQTIPLAANGHGAFVIPQELPETTGVQGIVQFQSSAGNLAGVGLRASPQGTFTSVPIIFP